MQFEFRDFGLQTGTVSRNTWLGCSPSHGFSCEHQQLSNSMASSSKEDWLQKQAADDGALVATTTSVSATMIAARTGYATLPPSLREQLQHSDDQCAGFGCQACWCLLGSIACTAAACEHKRGSHLCSRFDDIAHHVLASNAESHRKLVSAAVLTEHLRPQYTGTLPVGDVCNSMCSP